MVYSYWFYLMFYSSSKKKKKEEEETVVKKLKMAWFYSQELYLYHRHKLNYMNSKYFVHRNIIPNPLFIFPHHSFYFLILSFILFFLPNKNILFSCVVLPEYNLIPILIDLNLCNMCFWSLKKQWEFSLFFFSFLFSF